MADPIEDIFSSGVGSQYGAGSVIGNPATGNTQTSQQSIQAIIPQNAPGIESRITQAMLNGDAMSADDIAMRDAVNRDAMLIKMFEDQYRPKNVAIPAQDRTTYFPGIDDPILKGTSSSRTLGSQPIFVRSGGYVPYGILDARKNALQQAAAKRAAALNEFEIKAPPVVKDPRLQKKVNDAFDMVNQKFIDDATKTYGQYSFAMLKDKRSSVGRRYQNALQNVDILARETDQVTDKISKLYDDIQLGKMTASEKTLKSIDDYFNLVGDFENGVVDVNLRKSIDKLNGEINLDNYLNEFVYKNLKANIAGWASNFTLNDQGDLYEAKQGTRESIKAQAKRLAKQMTELGGQYYKSGVYTADEIENRLTSMIEDQVKVEVKGLTRRISGAGYNRITDPNQIAVQGTKKIEIEIPNPEEGFFGDKNKIVSLDARNIVDTGGTDKDPAITFTGAKVIRMNEDGSLDFKPVETQQGVPIRYMELKIGDEYKNVAVVRSPTGEFQKTDAINGTPLPMEEWTPIMKTNYILVDGQEGTLANATPVATRVFSEHTQTKQKQGVKAEKVYEKNKVGTVQDPLREPSNNKAPYGEVVTQGGVTYRWDGSKYVKQ